MAVKSVTYLQVERKKQKRVESLKEASRQVKARQKIALWVVQHYDGQKTIKTIEVGKIYTYGILASGGRSVSVIINVMILGLNNL
ncbi:hypothetical protein [Ligilactobacillus apodemi]|uniref:hypothetical protein n=1 Tax=Ligilactobacillus apodemi TaxID=307126 RepID=UPI00214B8797|nr:hypothetical protein [Ligilactobacillus apodemi]MCR1900662.1 hypothetical protein [Ligilactobacillus apodemi]